MHIMRQEIIDARRRIQMAMDVTGLNASNLAREAGFAESTLTRLMGPSPQSAPTYRTMVKVFQAVERLTGRKLPDLVPSTTDMACPKQSHLDGTYGMVQIPEFDVQAAAGAGLEVPDLQDASRIWTLPRSALAGVRATSLNNLAIVTVAGESMIPDYLPGEKVLVDVGDRTVSHDGAYIIHNRYGLVVKMVQIIPGSSPEQDVLRIISKNPDYSPYDQPVADVMIQGRVVGKWVWK